MTHKKTFYILKSNTTNKCETIETDYANYADNKSMLNFAR